MCFYSYYDDWQLDIDDDDNVIAFIDYGKAEERLAVLNKESPYWSIWQIKVS